MTSEQRRVQAASLLRDLGHDFVSHELDDAQLDEVTTRIDGLLALVRTGSARTRAIPKGALERFRMAVPESADDDRHHLFGDSIVSGAANPMGLGASFWREGATSVMEVTLGKAFEGAPGRAHGGVVAALLDETMGLVNAINEVLAFTAQLDITFVAATPVNETLTARAWLEGTDGRKLTIAATLESGGVIIARASALFIAVDSQRFLTELSALEAQPPS